MPKNSPRRRKAALEQLLGLAEVTKIPPSRAFRVLLKTACVAKEPSRQRFLEPQRSGMVAAELSSGHEELLACVGYAAMPRLTLFGFITQLLAREGLDLSVTARLLVADS